MTHRYQQFTHQLSQCFFVMVMLTSVTMAAPTPDHASPTKVRRLLTSPKTTDQDRTLLEGIKEGSVKTIYYEISSGPPTHYLLLIFDPQPDRYQFHLYTGIEGMFHRVRSRGASRSSGKASWTLFDRHSAREVGWPSVIITYDPKESRVREQFIYDKLTLICNTNQSQTMLEKTLVLKRLPPERERSLNESLLLTETPQRVYSAHRLFRDEWGMYYLIEKRELLEVGERFRLLRGYRGEMRQIPMITAAEDSEGLVMIGKESAIRLVSPKRKETRIQASSLLLMGEQHRAFWIEGKPGAQIDTRKPLIEIPIEMNHSLIFNELGLYNHDYLGSPCDPVFDRHATSLSRLRPEESQ